jgi:hypothetical protein
MDCNALIEPGKEFFIFQRRRNPPPALLAMSSPRLEPHHHHPKVFPVTLSFSLENSSIDGVSSRQKIDEKWPLPVPEDSCHDFSF